MCSAPPASPTATTNRPTSTCSCSSAKELTVRRCAPMLRTYFELVEGLESILGKPVDVVTVNGLDNPYFRAQVLAQREQLYAA